MVDQVAKSVLARKASIWPASIGFTQVSPDVTSGSLSAPSLPNTKVDVNSKTQLTTALNCAVSDNVVINMPLGFGFKHEVSSAGAIAGVGVIVTTKVPPITLIGQYRFMDAKSAFRPYVGGGMSYVNFYKEKGKAVLTALTNPGGPATTIKFEDKFAPTIQLGMVYNINEKWYVDANYTKTFLRTVGTLSTGQTLSTKLDPDGYTFQVGYKF